MIIIIVLFVVIWVSLYWHHDCYYYYETLIIFAFAIFKDAIFIIMVIVVTITILHFIVPVNVTEVVIVVATIYDDVFIYHQLTSPSTFIFNPSTIIMTSISLYSFC